MQVYTREEEEEQKKLAVLAYLADHFSERSGSREQIILFLDDRPPCNLKGTVLPASLHLPSIALTPALHLALASSPPRRIESAPNFVSAGPCFWSARPIARPGWPRSGLFATGGLSVEWGGGVSLFRIMIQLTGRQCQMIATLGAARSLSD